MTNDFYFRWHVVYCLEDYVGGIMMKSKEINNHVDDLRKSQKYRQYKVRVNTLKCSWDSRVSSKKFFGFIIQRKGIDLDPPKHKATQAMEPTMTYKQLKSFIVRVSYVHRFIAALVELLNSFQKMLKRNRPFQWGGGGSKRTFPKS